MFSPIVSEPLTVWASPPSGERWSYWSMRTAVRASNAAAVLVGPPVDHRPGAVVLRALVVEAVADLVADDGADRAVVDRVVGVGMEERRLEDGGREHDLVHRGVVVRVDRLRGHVPLVAVDGGADLGQLAVHGDGERAAGVAEQVGGVGLQRGVVLELLGVADLRGERGELLQRPLLGGVAHPRQRADALAVGRDEVVDELAHALLGGGRELGADVDLADRLAHRALDEPDAALPARTQLVGAAERASVELEVGVDERGRQVRRAAVHDVPAQPVAPGRQLVVDEQRRRGPAGTTAGPPRPRPPRARGSWRPWTRR